MIRRYLCWILVPLLTGGAAFGLRSGALVRLWSRITGRNPVLECPFTVDIGEADIGRTASARLTVRNSGGEELAIDDVRSACTCTGLEAEVNGALRRVQSLHLAPGEARELVLHIIPDGDVGSSFRSRITFRTNDPTRLVSALDIVIEKLRGTAVTNPTIVLFPHVPLGAEARQIVEIRDKAVQSRSIGSVESLAPERLRARLLPEEGSPAHRATDVSGKLIGRLEIEIRTDKPGHLDSGVRIRLAEDGDRPTLLPVRAWVAPLAEALPGRLVLPRRSPTGPLDHWTCRCLGVPGKPLGLSVVSVSAGLTAQVSPSPKGDAVQWVVIGMDPTKALKHGSPWEGKVVLRARVAERSAILEIPVLYEP